MESYNNGKNMYAGYNTKYVSLLYVEDLRTGKQYVILDEISQSFMYDYKTIVGFLIKRVEKAEKAGERKQWGRTRALADRSMLSHRSIPPHTITLFPCMPWLSRS